MKHAYAFALTFLLTAGCLWASPVSAIESLGYTVLETHDDIEIRRYDAHLLATVEVSTDFEQAGNRAFRDLFNYIDGDNLARENIAMTAPVIQTPAASGWAISFVMPASYDIATLPEPRGEHVHLQTEPVTVMAAFTYRGNWSRERYDKAETALRNTLTGLGYSTCAAPRFARHNPPFWPTFLRKNEVLIPLCDTAEQTPATP